MSPLSKSPVFVATADPQCVFDIQNAVTAATIPTQIKFFFDSVDIAHTLFQRQYPKKAQWDMRYGGMLKGTYDVLLAQYLVR